MPRRSAVKSLTFEKATTAIQQRAVHVSEHASAEALDDDLDIVSVVMGVPDGEVLEDYPTDPRGSSCLVLLRLEPNHKPVHVVLGYDDDLDRAIVITVYRPHPTKWSDDFRHRRSSKP